MKNQLQHLCAVITFFLLITRTATPQYVAPISKLDVPAVKAPIKIDGKPDASYSGWQSTMIAKEVGTGVTPHPGDSVDFNLRFKVCWDYKYLYFFADVTDDIASDYLIGDSQPWTFDNVEVFIDLDTNSTISASSAPGNYSTTSTTQMRFCRGLLARDGSDSLVEFNVRGAGGSGVTQPSAATAQREQYKFWEDATTNLEGKPGWHIEVAIPWSAATDSASVDITPLTVQAGGTVLGFDVAGADGDPTYVSTNDGGRNDIGGAQSFWDLDDPLGTGTEDDAYYNRLVFGFISLTGHPSSGIIYSATDSAALRAIDQQCDLKDSLNWNTEPDPGKWTGVTWSSGTVARVVGLTLFNKDLGNSMDVSKLTALTKLDCDKNQLTSINASELSNLDSLYCQENQLTHLNVTGLSNLTFLNCSNNKLTDPDFSTLADLKYLDCSNNVLTSINISMLTNLIYLYCNSNQLSSLDVSNLTNLDTLQCSNNQLSSLDVSQLSSLADMSCDDDQLTSLDVSGLSQLMYLSCNNNHLTNLDVSGTGLQYLHCNNNKLTHLDVLSLNNLADLDCGWNDLTNLDLSTLIDPVHVHCDNNNLPFSSLITGLKTSDFDYSPQNTLYTSYTTDHDTLLNYLTETKIDTSTTQFIFYKDSIASDTNDLGLFLTSGSGIYYCKMTNTLFPGLTLTTANVIVNTSMTSVKNTNLSTHVKVYPNPSNGLIKVILAADMTNAEITIFSITGRQVYEQKMNDLREAAINLSDLHAGIYILRVTNNVTTVSKKIILQQ